MKKVFALEQAKALQAKDTHNMAQTTTHKRAQAACTHTAAERRCLAPFLLHTDQKQSEEEAALFTWIVLESGYTSKRPKAAASQQKHY